MVPGLSVSLWELRALLEAQVRVLNDAQRQLDLFQNGTDLATCDAVLLGLQLNLERVLKANLMVQRSAQEAAEYARTLTAGSVARTSGAAPVELSSLGSTRESSDRQDHRDEGVHPLTGELQSTSRPPPCDPCGQTETHVATRTPYVLYIRCPACSREYGVWRGQAGARR